MTGKFLQRGGENIGLAHFWRGPAANGFFHPYNFFIVLTSQYYNSK